ncbi:hypothetical protein C8R44DRAFT_875260 [Mycena epipterygia]|nr:hypothetical protein C8R44DRAFT_875260 [Mycena epipterygia]
MVSNHSQDTRPNSTKQSIVYGHYGSREPAINPKVAQYPVIDNNGKSVSLVVADLCPGFQGANGIDLTEGAMASLEPNYIAFGKITVDWAFA